VIVQTFGEKFSGALRAFFRAEAAQTLRFYRSKLVVVEIALGRLFQTRGRPNFSDMVEAFGPTILASTARGPGGAFGSNGHMAVADGIPARA